MFLKTPWVFLLTILKSQIFPSDVSYFKFIKKIYENVKWKKLASRSSPGSLQSSVQPISFSLSWRQYQACLLLFQCKYISIESIESPKLFKGIFPNFCLCLLIYNTNMLYYLFTLVDFSDCCKGQHSSQSISVQVFQWCIILYEATQWGSEKMNSIQGIKCQISKLIHVTCLYLNCR